MDYSAGDLVRVLYLCVCVCVCVPLCMPVRTKAIGVLYVSCVCVCGFGDHVCDFVWQWSCGRLSHKPSVNAVYVCVSVCVTLYGWL